MLSTLRIGLSDDDIAGAGGDGPLVNGRGPSKRIGIESWYEDLGLDVPFNGTLTLGRDFIEQLYVHMGFPPAWKYRAVAELRFRDGVLESAEDVSERVARQRAEAGASTAGVESPLDRIRGWVRRMFGR